jgi:hypothetical protein
MRTVMNVASRTLATSPKGLDCIAHLAGLERRTPAGRMAEDFWAE